MEKLDFTNWSQVNWNSGCGEISIFQQRKMIAPPPSLHSGLRKNVSLSDATLWPSVRCCDNHSPDKCPQRTSVPLDICPPTQPVVHKGLGAADKLMMVTILG